MSNQPPDRPPGPPEGWQPPLPGGPTQPLSGPGQGWGQPSPGPPRQQRPAWGPPPPSPPRPPTAGGLPWYQRLWWAIAFGAFVLGAAIAGASQPEPKVRTQTVTHVSERPVWTPECEKIPNQSERRQCQGIMAGYNKSLQSATTTTVPKVAVPKLVGAKLAKAKSTLIDRGLHWSTKYKTTVRYSSGTVISQSPKAEASVAPGSKVTLLIAKAPPPPPTTSPPSPPTTAPRNCDPSYPDVCLHQGIGDYDCAGGSGNGPNYVEGPITVRPPDPFDLDGNGDGIGCERG